ncbi:hypothetical protein [Actinoallomurus iriomotensis]|uniref:hypothetical protein n=1 Tax=Actinoallomurus iriomotensis TaxID=478107 RepID=UPI002554EF53|nr:hypothetical protein [Actinoallomurus iriomotensis]
MGDDLATPLRVLEGVAEFVVTTRDPVCGERLVPMGRRPAGDGSYVRRLSATGDVARGEGGAERVRAVGRGLPGDGRVAGRRVRVPPLDLRLAIARRRGLTDRAAVVRGLVR